MNNKNADYAEYRHLVDEITSLAHKKSNIIIAIDGPCGSGKTYLADYLSTQLDCQVFHMDDFFLPFERKTKERLAEPGGNVDYERFHNEVLQPLAEQKPVHFRPYNCQIRDYDDSIDVKPKQINIVEGVYALHPQLAHLYDLKVFLTVDPVIQHSRIAKRNGEDKLQTFINTWIPMENHYFTELNIEAQCDIVIDNSRI